MHSISEFGNHGSLFDVIENIENGFSEDVCKYIFLKILKGVEDLHKIQFAIDILNPKIWF